MSNYIQLKSQIQKLQKEAEIVRKREISKTIANIKKAIAAFNLTAADLGLSGDKATKPGRAGKKAAGKTGQRGREAKKTAVNKSSRKSSAMDKRSIVAPKYRDSASGATWTGRGKQPRWLAAALKEGKKLEEFII